MLETVYLSREGGRLTLWDEPGEGRVEATVERFADGSVIVRSQGPVPENGER